MVSIIIPVYNAEKYLEECLTSVVTQSGTDLEVILVNDGSTDNSLTICREFAAADRRIRVADQENSGVSAARNLGISMARGEYLLFVDADDFLRPEAVRKICAQLEGQKKPDLLVWGFHTAGEGRIVNDIGLLERNPEGFSNGELLEHLVSIAPQERFRGFVWRCAFRKQIIEENRLRFSRTIKMSEDYFFLLQFLMHARSVAVLPEKLYVYRLNNSSVTSKYAPNCHNDMAEVNRWMGETVCKAFPELRNGYAACCAETYVVAMQNLCNAGTPYPLPERIREACRLRRQFGYSAAIRSVCRSGQKLSGRQKLVYGMLLLRLEAVYIILFSLKKKTLGGAV